MKLVITYSFKPEYEDYKYWAMVKEGTRLLFCKSGKSFDDARAQTLAKLNTLKEAQCCRIPPDEEVEI